VKRVVDALQSDPSRSRCRFRAWTEFAQHLDVPLDLERRARMAYRLDDARISRNTERR
jgi:hypothetical protein